MKTNVKFQVLTAMGVKMTVFWDVALCGILVMEAVSTSETSVTFYETTRRNIPEDVRHQINILHIRRCANFRLHINEVPFIIL
jgi:hypothetical protein